MNAHNMNDKALWVAALAALASGCNALGGDDPGDIASAGPCGEVAGTYVMDWGSCPAGPAVCTITQTDCDIESSCSNGVSLYGSVDGETVSWVESSGARCSAELNGGSADGTCSYEGSSCSFSASRQASTSAGSGGGAGSAPEDTCKDPINQSGQVCSSCPAGYVCIHHKYTGAARCVFPCDTENDCACENPSAFCFADSGEYLEGFKSYCTSPL
jgi:hypothetical protein